MIPPGASDVGHYNNASPGSKRKLGELAVAVLVLLARAARARVVAPDLLRMAHRGLHFLLRRRLGKRDVAVSIERFIAGRLAAVRAAVHRSDVLDVHLLVGLDVVLAAYFNCRKRLDHFELDR